MIDTCRNGHTRTTENTGLHYDSQRNRYRKRCLSCKRDSNPRKDGLSASQMTRQATDFLHEDIEDLIRLGATYAEIIARGGYADWNTLSKSLKRRGRDDLLDKMREKRVKV